MGRLRGISTPSCPKLGYNIAIMRMPYKKIGAVAAALAALVAFADEPEPSGRTSDSAFIFLAPEASFFWHTATNSTMTLPVEFPD